MASQSSPVSNDKTARSTDPRRAGFTLTELLITIAVIGLLVVLLLPGAKSAMAQAGKVKAIGNMKKMFGVWQAYASDNSGTLMPTAGTYPNSTDEGYWPYWMKQYTSPSQTDYLAAATTGDPKKYGFLMSPVKGPLDTSANGQSWLSLNVWLGSNLANPNGNYTISRIRYPSKTVVFGDSQWEIFAHSWYGECSLTFRYNKNESSIFGLADGHIETVTTRKPGSPANASSAQIPKGYYYTLEQEEPWQ